MSGSLKGRVGMPRKPNNHLFTIHQGGAQRKLHIAITSKYSLFVFWSLVFWSLVFCLVVFFHNLIIIVSYLL